MKQKLALNDCRGEVLSLQYDHDDKFIGAGKSIILNKLFISLRRRHNQGLQCLLGKVATEHADTIGAGHLFCTCGTPGSGDAIHLLEVEAAYIRGCRPSFLILGRAGDDLVSGCDTALACCVGQVHSHAQG